MKIDIRIGEDHVTAEMLNNHIARAIYQSLPLESTYHVWGDEFYFHLPLQAGLENGQEIVDIGDLAYWPPGQAFCIFFGPTPVSIDHRPRAASDVTVFGKIIGGVECFKQTKAKTIRIQKIEHETDE